VVLNSLSGDYIPLSLDRIDENGTFIEIGKRGIWTADQVAAKYPAVHYHVIALDTINETQPDEFQRLLHSVCDEFDRDLWSPLPLKKYDFEREYLEAFYYLRSGRNIGKVVLSLQNEESMTSHSTIEKGTYIITGGLGAIGLLSAKVLVSFGAKRLVLISRSGKISNEGK
jgi:hypothetical protein